MNERPISRLGSYLVETRIASGGMGEVYRATATGPDGVQKPVAIKLVRDDLLRERHIVQMFVEEAKVAFLLTHPNIVQTYELGQVDGHYFLVMEYVRGLSLEKLLKHTHQGLGQPLPLSIALYVAARVARGLAYAHELCDHQGEPLGIVHRDVSPGNILLSEDGQVKLVDFGLAKSVLRRAESQAGGVKGKLAYMAPEQLRGEALDARADIYALGITLFEMLAGHNPFGLPGEVTLLSRLGGKTPSPGSAQLAPHVEPPIPALVDRCLANDASDRFASAREFGRELDRGVAELGLTLSDYDVADFVAEARKSDDHDPVTALGPDPFDRALGMQLHRVAGADGVATFATLASSSSSSAPSSNRTPGRRAAADTRDAKPVRVSDRQSASTAPRRLLWLAGAAALSLVTLGVWLSRQDSRSPNQDHPTASTTARRDARSAVFLPTGSVTDGPEASDAKIDGVSGSPRGDSSVDAEPHPKSIPTILPQPSGAQETVRSAKRRPPRSRRVRPKRTGLLSLNSAPWAVVYLDGRRLRSTPLVAYRLTAGKHTVRLVNPARGLAKTIRIQVEADQHIKRSVRLMARE